MRCVHFLLTIENNKFWRTTLLFALGHLNLGLMLIKSIKRNLTNMCVGRGGLSASPDPLAEKILNDMLLWCVKIIQNFSSNFNRFDVGTDF